MLRPTPYRRLRFKSGQSGCLPPARIALVTVSAADAGARLDTFLAARLPSRSAAQRLVEAGHVRIGAETAEKASRRLRAGERVLFRLPQPEPLAVEPEPIPVDVLYEDEDLLVINKAKGMVVHPAPGNPRGTLVNALLYRCAGTLSGIGGVARPGIVHRLDRDTSGAMLVAKNDMAHLSLARQIKEHSARRVYVALVHGAPPDRGEVRAPLGRHPVRRREMAVVAAGKPAVTHFRVLERLGPYSLIEARLETGRTHQIRVHMAHIGFPVVGDPVYGPRLPQLFGDGQALHAWQISFTHPRLLTRMCCVAPLPPGFAAVIAALRAKHGA